MSVSCKTCGYMVCRCINNGIAHDLRCLYCGCENNIHAIDCLTMRHQAKPPIKASPEQSFHRVYNDPEAPEMFEHFDQQHVDAVNARYQVFARASILILDGCASLSHWGMHEVSA